MADDRKERFVTLSEEEFSRVIDEKDSKNTKKVTSFAVNTFRAYLKEKNFDEHFENMSVDELDSVLAKFYAEARQANGEMYKRTSLFSLRHGLSRFLSTQKGGQCDIIHGKEFRLSKLAFDASTKQLKPVGKGGIEHFQVLVV